ncbi:MAG: DUF1361 domain-containing protein [Gorillibacterium sp.]|nr:DUF1361 domain-containing protein [Gorillibacterium sp.]
MLSRSRFQGLGYPHKLYLLLFLMISSVINLKMLYDLWLPSGFQPYLFIFWNFFLAWLPIVFMLLLDLAYTLKQGLLRRGLILTFGALWLFFYPNAPYLVTDMLHVFANYSFDPNQRFWGNIEFWQHLLALFFVALLGLMLGAIALFSVQSLVRKSLGRIWSWVFVTIVLLLSSFGVYAGRFLRWNSWDLATGPTGLFRELKNLVGEQGQAGDMWLFCWLIFLITFVSYLVMFLFSRIKFDA